MLGETVSPPSKESLICDKVVWVCQFAKDQGEPVPCLRFVKECKGGVGNDPTENNRPVKIDFGDWNDAAWPFKDHTAWPYKRSHMRGISERRGKSGEAFGELLDSYVVHRPGQTGSENVACGDNCYFNSSCVTFLCVNAICLARSCSGTFTSL